MFVGVVTPCYQQSNRVEQLQQSQHFILATSLELTMFVGVVTPRYQHHTMCNIYNRVAQLLQI